ncbi:junctional sarcoplasmic reticulum protein 1 isoform X1 [Channa argus]|uniref:junctional sarcoplasmic reticulum protein 1 isoform X1 n=1 Tax=Channa argus TaxID=215402 RepID=UPI00352074C8
MRQWQGMDKSYETFEEELGPSGADPPPQNHVRQICRPEMYATRKIREEVASVPQLPGGETKTSPKQPNLPSAPSLHTHLPIQTQTQTETPWKNVTLNRCLFVAITILALTSGFQRLHATLRGHRNAEEEEVGLRVRQPGTLRHRLQQPEPETSLWDVMFWLPNFDDEDDEMEEENDRDREWSTKKARASRGLRNKPLPEKNLMKQTRGKLKDRRAKKVKDKKAKDKRERERNEELKETPNDEIEGDNEDEN